MRVYTREMAAANWSDAEMLRLIEVLRLFQLWVVPSTALLLKLALILPFSVNYGTLTRTDFSLLTASVLSASYILGTTSVCKRNKSDGVVRDAITDQSTQHARKFVSRAVDTRAHMHRYYHIIYYYLHAGTHSTGV